jgi:hypothetical protein
MLVVLLLMMGSSIAVAIPSADFTYVETDLGGGIWQYDYMLFNTSDPVADAGFDLYDLFFTFTPSPLFTVLSVPSGWDWIGDPSGFLLAFSLNPGAPPVGTDIAPGESLGGFFFSFDYQAGALPFDVTFTNPNDPDMPEIYSGTSSSSSAVPEPSTLLLVAVGLVGLVGLRRELNN